jgi:hypothetical protein
MLPELSKYKLVLEGETSEEQWSYLQKYKSGQWSFGEPQSTSIESEDQLVEIEWARRKAGYV